MGIVVQAENDRAQGQEQFGHNGRERQMKKNV
jgi:hypothetical protein